MARKARNSVLESRTSRLKLEVRRKPYPGPKLARGVQLLYRRNRTNGAWIVKVADGHGKYWTRGVGLADDFDENNLTFYAAQDAAKQLARGGGTEADAAAPITVDRALADYRLDLISRNADPCNASQPRRHLTATLLAKPVMLLASKELKAWRDSLLAKLAPASINRVCNSICAALELSAQHDPRIKDRNAWEVGLAGLPNTQRARNVARSDATIHALVATSYARDYQLGLFVDAAAVTGARSSQLARLRVEDLHDHPSKPKLMLPKSGKGGGRNRAEKKLERYSVPVTVELSRKLKAAAAGRAGDEPLLLRSNGASWGNDPSKHYRDPVREIVAAVGEDPDEVTLYSLRHSNIVRMLRQNKPIRMIAALHNTSVGQIESNYSKYITENDIDDIMRAGLLSEPAPAADNVVALKR